MKTINQKTNAIFSKLNILFNPYDRVHMKNIMKDDRGSMLALCRLFCFIFGLGILGLIGKQYGKVWVRLVSLDKNKVVAVEGYSVLSESKNFIFNIPDSIASKIEFDCYEAAVLGSEIEMISFYILDRKNPSIDLNSYQVEYKSSKRDFTPNVQLSESFMQSRKKYMRSR